MDIVTNGLVGYWHYQKGVNGSTWENIAPLTKGQYNGVITGATVDANGMYFDGVDDYVYMTQHNEEMKGKSEYTYQALIKIDPNVNAPWNTMFFTRNEDAAHNYPQQDYEIRVDSGKASFLYNVGDVSNTYYDGSRTGSPLTLTGDDILLTIVVKRDGSGQMGSSSVEMYFGTQLYSGFYNTSKTIPAGLNFAYAALSLGAAFNISSRGYVSSFWNGHIKAFRMYNRALSTQELKQNFTVGSNVGLDNARIITDGLVGYWNFNKGISGTTWENLAPATRGQYNGTITGATLTAGGVQFDGVDDYVDLGTVTHPSNKQQYTFEAWVDFDGYSDGVNRYLSIFGSRSSTSIPYLMINYRELSSPKYRFLYSPDLHDYESMSGALNDLQPNTLYHVVLSIDAVSGNNILFVNGQYRTFSTSSVMTDLLPFHFLGRNRDGATVREPFKGRILAARFYSRGLTLPEIRQNHSVGTEVGLYVVRDGLVGYWHHLQQGSVTDVWENIAPATSGQSNMTIRRATPTVDGMYFDGVDDYAFTADYISALQGKSNFSIQLYTTLESKGDSTPHTVFLYVNELDAQHPRYWAYMYNSTLWIVAASDSYNGFFTTSYVIPQQGNYQFTVTVEDEGTNYVMRLYVNNQLVQTQNSPSPSTVRALPHTYGQLSLGATYYPIQYSGYHGEHWEGYIKSVRMYDRALGVGEIASNYALGGDVVGLEGALDLEGAATTNSRAEATLSGGTRKIVTEGLKAYWNYKEGVTPTAWKNIAPATIGSYNGVATDTTLTENGVYFNGSTAVINFPAMGITNQSFSVEFLYNYEQGTEDIGNLLIQEPYSSSRRLGLENAYNDIILNFGMGNIWRDNSLKRNQVQHVVYTYDHTTKAERLFVDNVEITDYDASMPRGTAADFNVTFSMAGRRTTDSVRYKGYILAARIYTKALSPTEVTNNFVIGDAIGIYEELEGVTSTTSRAEAELSKNFDGKIVTEGLVGYWHYMDGFDGTIWENIAPNTLGHYDGDVRRATLASNGVQFVASNSEYVRMLEHNTHLQGKEKYTFQFMATLKSATSSTYDTILAYRNNRADQANPTQRFSVNTTNMRYRVSTGTGAHLSVTPALPSTSDMHLVTIVVNDTPTKMIVDLYLNDTLIGTYASSDTSTEKGKEYSFGALAIGALYHQDLAVADEYYDGIVQFVRLYDRALTISEIEHNLSMGSEIGLAGRVEFSGSAQTTTSSEALLSVDMPITGTANQVSNTDAKVDVLRALTASTTTVSTATGQLNTKRDTDLTAEVKRTTSAQLHILVDKQLSTSTKTTATVQDVAINVARPLQSTVKNTTRVELSIETAIELKSTISSQSSTEATVEVLRELTASTTTTTTAQGTLAGFKLHDLEGRSNNYTSAELTTLTRIRELEASITVTSSTEADLVYVIGLEGAVTTTSSVDAADIDINYAIQGQAKSKVTIEPLEVAEEKNIVSIIHARTRAVLSIDVESPERVGLNGSTKETTDAEASISRFYGLTASTINQTRTEIDYDITRGLSATVSIDASTEAIDLELDKDIFGSSQDISTANATILRDHGLYGSSLNTSRAAGRAHQTHNLAGLSVIRTKATLELSNEMRAMSKESVRIEAALSVQKQNWSIMRTTNRASAEITPDRGLSATVANASSFSADLIVEKALHHELTAVISVASLTEAPIEIESMMYTEDVERSRADLIVEKDADLWADLHINSEATLKLDGIRPLAGISRVFVTTEAYWVKTIPIAARNRTRTRAVLELTYETNIRAVNRIRSSSVAEMVLESELMAEVAASTQAIGRITVAQDREYLKYTVQVKGSYEPTVKLKGEYKREILRG